MFKRLLPFIIASILAIVLSFIGEAQAIIGGLGLILGFLVTLFVSTEDEEDTDAKLKAFRSSLEDVKSDVFYIKTNDDKTENRRDIAELHRRLLMLEKNQTGNDPFGG